MIVSPIEQAYAKPNHTIKLFNAIKSSKTIENLSKMYVRLKIEDVN